MAHQPPPVPSAPGAAFMSPGLGAGQLAPPINSSTPLGPSVSAAQPRKMNPPGSHGDGGGKALKQKAPKSSLMPGAVGMAGPPGCGSASATGVQVRSRMASRQRNRTERRYIISFISFFLPHSHHFTPCVFACVFILFAVCVCVCKFLFVCVCT